MAVKKTRAFLAAGGAVVLALVATGCGSADASEAPVDRKSFPLSGKTLTVVTDDSRLELVPADVKDVEVERQVDGWVFLGSGPDPVWEMKGDKLTLTVNCDGLSQDCTARHSLKVPRGVAVTVDDDNGNVHAGGFDTDMRIRSDNGAVIVKDMSGNLHLESDNGKIEGEGLSAKSVTAKSDNGRITLGFTAVPDLVEGVSDNGAIRLTLPKSPYKVDASSSNGAVRVDVPKADSSTHVVKARSDNGEVTVQSAN
ncbi:DUF4097 family beta strand repeat-containing protein [Streptomyces candidus]|nr:lipoprotein [Streptomyces candidus]